jgi:hypothetical protein
MMIKIFHLILIYWAAVMIFSALDDLAAGWPWYVGAAVLTGFVVVHTLLTHQESNTGIDE